MAETSNVARLRNLKSAIKNIELSNNALHTSVFHVVDIKRFMIDPQYLTQTGTKGSLVSTDGYEMTICDKKEKQKVVLSPVLSKLVQNKQLQIGSQIELTECDLHYDETDLSGNSIVIVNSLIINKTNGDIASIKADSLQWCSDGSAKESEDQPIVSSRGYYVSFWSTAEMSGDIWNTEVQMSDSLGDISVDDLYSVKELAKKWTSIRSAQPAVLVRVLFKSRLIHYAKPSKDDKWPFQVHLTVGDQSGACRLVIWNALCPRLFTSIHEQSILLVKNFTVKKSFMMSNKQHGIPADMDMYDIDINLNSHHPVAKIKILTLSAVPKGLDLPSPKYFFVTRLNLGFLPDNVICDVAGLVTYVGRYEREPMHMKHGPDSGGYWIRRWIFLHDGTKDRPIILQLYRAAQVSIIDSIKPGDLILCRHMRVVQGLDLLTGSRFQRTVHLTSTAGAQIISLENNRFQAFRNEPIIRKVISWSRSQVAKHYVNKSAIGGYFSYPPLSSSLEDFRRINPYIQITMSEDWQSVVDSLCFRERCQLSIQAELASVETTSVDVVTRHVTRSSKRLKKQSSHKDDSISSPIEDSFPETVFSWGSGPSSVAFNEENWNDIQERLAFPNGKWSEITDDHETSGSFDKGPQYLRLCWNGLNSRVTLKSLKPCVTGSELDESFLQIINKDTVPGESCGGTDQARINAILSSANEMIGQRFLVILDCYYHGPDKKEIIVNRAYHL